MNRPTDPIISSIPCATSQDPECTDKPENYVAGVQERPPAFLPWATPAYVNDGFFLLGLALTNITGKTLDEVFRNAIFDFLDMTRSNSSAPDPSERFGAAIPGDPQYFAIDNILNNTLLSADETRKWVKPISRTARLENFDGVPWEISRYTHTATGVVTDIYTKSGDSG
ncbi:uncharacterized protein Z518_01180 [Rhinocladiella mackenziei CBS 650.93]|uniref:Beta-lactamase-related domain-containing protein n=1 Tax=Rhinocladiella mackenziei CBS 650.93 TaxID=1442369 RepID=A0A0D2IVN6_9EURO|nr:uncharacterized protein Z518_01180 [Rhinocladiella mackenziei CBS 650.93]KIX10099.1 hypothetical protein Z518_01180 [Rhinocladiella mackenziei CBS 650.93]